MLHIILINFTSLYRVFSKVPFSFINNALTITSLIQLNTIHISRDKHLTILFDNKKRSKIDGSIRWEIDDLSQMASSKEDYVFKVDCQLSHRVDLEDNSENKTLHKWEFSSKYSTLKNSKATKMMISLTRKVYNGSKWKVFMISINTHMVIFYLIMDGIMLQNKVNIYDMNIE